MGGGASYMNTVVDRFEKDTQLILRLMSMGGICMDTETDGC